MRPFRFGLLAAGATSRREWLDNARRAESAGYTSLLIADHIRDQFGPIAAAMSVADATGLRIGFLVLCNDLRHPAVVAKEAATLDLLSEGRLELGIGAGWLTVDYDVTGLPMDLPGVRIDRLGEAVAILKGLFSGEGEFTFSGDHYRIGPITGSPRCRQTPHPPLLIGGGGRRILELAVREAQIVGISPNFGAGRADPAVLGKRRTSTAMSTSVRYVREAVGAGTEIPELNLVIVEAVVTDDRRRAAADIGARMNLSVDEVLGAPQVLVGTVDQICEQLRSHRAEFGFSYFVAGASVWRALEPVVERMVGA